VFFFHEARDAMITKKLEQMFKLKGGIGREQAKNHMPGSNNWEEAQQEGPRKQEQNKSFCACHDCIQCTSNIDREKG
jgi:hypothetical protein